MMTTDSTSTGLSGLLPQILGGLDENGVLDSADSGEFVQSLAGQIKSLMLQRGDDPIEVAAIDDASLVAQFFALIQGQTEPLAAGLSETATGLSVLMGDALAPLESADTVGVSAEESPEEMSDSDAKDAPVSLLALPNVVLERLSASNRILPTDAQASEPVVNPPASEVDAVHSSADLETLARAFWRQATPSAVTAGPAAAPEQLGQSDSRPVDLETLTRALLRQTAADDVIPEPVGKPQAVEATPSLPAWLAQTLKSSGPETGSNTSILAPAASEAFADPPFDSMQEALLASKVSGDRLPESSLDLQTSMESAEFTDLAPAGAMRASVTTTDTQTIGLRPPILDLNRLLQPGGEQRLADHVHWSVEQGLETAEIKLHPPSLGTLDVRVVQEGDKTHVQFVSAHPVAREVLDAAIPRLREALAQDGVLLGNVTVSDQTPNDRGETGRERGGSAGTGESETEEETDPVELHGTISMLSRRLDVFT